MMIDRPHLYDHVEKIAGIKLLVIGDVMLDHFIHGVVDRISPEAPIPVLRVIREDWMLGGAGNVARNATALGADVSLVAVVGNDDTGRTLIRLVNEEGRLTGNLVVDSQRMTTLKTRYVAMGQQLLRADREDSSPAEASVEVQLLQAIDREVRNADVVVVSDYAKGAVTRSVAACVVRVAKAQGKAVIVDTKATDILPFRGASLATPNGHELSVLTRQPTTSSADVERAAAKLMNDFSLDGVVVTRAELGMSVITRDMPPTHLVAEAREVFDVSGAGDTVLAVLALAIGAGATIVDAAALANTAAGIVVGKAGTAVVHADELSRQLRASELASTQSKIVSLDKVLDQVARWRGGGLSVGFTNGFFDLLHPGHVALLSQARAQCDRLIVGLNTDVSVRKLKGEGRPVNAEMARAVVLAALETVDAVVTFSDDTPIKLIETIKPDVLVKGADYTIDKVVGADFVTARGGRVLLIDLVPGQSTTGTIIRMTR